MPSRSASTVRSMPPRLLKTLRAESTAFEAFAMMDKPLGKYIHTPSILSTTKRTPETSSTIAPSLDVIRKGEKLSLEQWADFFLENYSKPPVRAEKTHQVNLRVARHLKNAFASRKLVDITADDIEIYLSDRLRKTVRVRTALGYRQMGVLKPTTVHQELRVLR